MGSNKASNEQADINREVTLNGDIEDTPLPQPQFAILLMVRFAEPVAFTFLFPFIYQVI
jgi:hypothetical protein